MNSSLTIQYSWGSIFLSHFTQYMNFYGVDQLPFHKVLAFKWSSKTYCSISNFNRICKIPGNLFLQYETVNLIFHVQTFQHSNIPTVGDHLFLWLTFSTKYISFQCCKLNFPRSNIPNRKSTPKKKNCRIHTASIL